MPLNQSPASSQRLLPRHLNGEDWRSLKRCEGATAPVVLLIVLCLPLYLISANLNCISNATSFKSSRCLPKMTKENDPARLGSEQKELIANLIAELVKDNINHIAKHPDLKPWAHNMNRTIKNMLTSTLLAEFGGKYPGDASNGLPKKAKSESASPKSKSEGTMTPQRNKAKSPVSPLKGATKTEQTLVKRVRDGAAEGLVLRVGACEDLTPRKRQRETHKAPISTACEE